MKIVQASGFLIFRRFASQIEFLLMKHSDRWDLPKGQVENTESLLETAYRELEEETGIQKQNIQWNPHFLYKATYAPIYSDTKPGEIEKTLYIYVARLLEEVEIQPTEHLSYKWFSWNPPHAVQLETIDPLLEKINKEEGLFFD